MGDLVAARRRWAYALIGRAKSPAPAYGSAAWLALPEGSPEKIAAVCVAAESHARAGDELEEDLCREIASLRRQHKLRDDEDYVAAARAHRERWAAKRTSKKSFVELRAEQLRAEQLRATSPRDGDHPGGAKDWTGGETA